VGSGLAWQAVRRRGSKTGRERSPLPTTVPRQRCGLQSRCVVSGVRREAWSAAVHPASRPRAHLV